MSKPRFGYFKTKKPPTLPTIRGGEPVFAGALLSLPAFLEQEIRADQGPFAFGGREPLREIADHLDEILHLGLPGGR